MFFFSVCYNTFADELTLKDGSKLNGEVLSKEKNSLRFKTTFAGPLTIKWDQVRV